MTEPMVEDRAAALLRRDDSPVPLARLYRDVVRELGPVLSGPDQLHACLRERPERFLVLDPPGETAYAAPWPEDARRAYASALEDTAFSPEPRVALASAARPATEEATGADDPGPREPPTRAHSRAHDTGDLLRRLDVSIRNLAGAASADPTVPAVLAEALAEAAALRRALSPGPEHAGPARAPAADEPSGRCPRRAGTAD